MRFIRWNDLTDREQTALLMRPAQKRDQVEAVQEIINAVKLCGDAALYNFAQALDGVELENLQVSPGEFNDAKAEVNLKTREALEFAFKQISLYHQVQFPEILQCESKLGIRCEREMRPIQAVGLYVPGGSAPLISTVLMLGIPSALAGCPLRILCTPPGPNGKINAHLLYAAELCGITTIYKVGGAQAIAAMAYGTATIPKVQKIFGPGNTWVMTAKMLIAEDPEGALIDMPAGPSELLVIADQDADPEFVAADLLSQAEHGPDSQVITLSNSENLLQEVLAAVARQTERAPRQEIIRKALINHARFIAVPDINTAIHISNRYAPEHLSLNVRYPELYRANIINAGAVFLGGFTPETMGDYVNGSNHVLPTSGYAASMSGLGIMDFIKFISFQEVTATTLQEVGPYAAHLAELEGLFAHQNAVSVRLAALKEQNT